MESGALTSAADEQWHVRLLYRWRLQCRPLDTAVIALVLDCFATQQPRDDLQRLGEGRMALVNRWVCETHGPELSRDVARAQAEDDAPLRDAVHVSHRSGQRHRVPVEDAADQ